MNSKRSYSITIKSTGLFMGLFRAESKTEAIKLYLVDAGYPGDLKEAAMLYGETVDEMLSDLIVE